MQCGVTRTSGSADLDAQTCVVLVRRAKFKAATDEQGNSTYNIWSGAINWTLPGQQPAKIPAGALNRLPQSDIELQVQQLPDGALEKSITVITRVDTSGHVAFCEGSKNDRDAVKLVAVACAQASALSLDVTKDNDGNPISMIRSLRVTFKVAA
ncbi:energy transducer TonB [Sphingobium sp. AP49]|uniref:energy transducer TonB n=1 Tax=Sphingobium sp. AP49 TaxID=1144307 RepID=UPI0024B3A154|nr:energy transducer TonB [Sphingobium sp. AP49]WHO40019.1 energy transducer TonB [Sphingobium sp. AP49]